MNPSGMRGTPVSPARSQPGVMPGRAVTISTPIQAGQPQTTRVLGRAHTARGSYAAPAGCPGPAMSSAGLPSMGYPGRSGTGSSTVFGTTAGGLRQSRSNAIGRTGMQGVTATGVSGVQPALSSGRVATGGTLTSPRAESRAASPSKPPSSTAAMAAAVASAAQQRPRLAARAAACVHPTGSGGRGMPANVRRGTSLATNVAQAAAAAAAAAGGGGAASSTYGLRGLKGGFNGCERSLSASVRLTSAGDMSSTAFSTSSSQVGAGVGGVGVRSSSALHSLASVEAIAKGPERMFSQPLPQHMGLGYLGALSSVERRSSAGEPESEPAEGHLGPATIMTNEDMMEGSFAKPKVPQAAKVDGSDLGTLKLDVRLEPSELIGWRELQIIEPISTGSFGEVFLARYHGQDVSVKRCILSNGGSMTKEQLHNLEREINTYRTLDHPQIVQYIGCVLEYPNLAIVTEYVPNGNVFDLLYTHRVNLPAASRLKIASQVSLAICYMHSCDPIVIHRDLKTQNVVLDHDYNVKLCDFGKTQPMDDDAALPMLQDNGGSPRYMAPECFKPGGYVTEKVDIWSLGCCLVEVFGGPLPYEDVPQMSQVLTLILRQQKPPLVPPWFTPEVRPMLSRCFDFDTTARLEISEVLLVLKRLTAENLERHGMDRRRTR